MLTVIVFLKLWSFNHFWDDVRKFIKRRKRLEAEGKKDKANQAEEETLVNRKNTLNSDMYEEIEHIIKDYPNNVKFFSLFEFLFMPVLCYQFKFPRTSHIRISQVLNYGIKLILTSFLQ